MIKRYPSGIPGIILYLLLNVTMLDAQGSPFPHPDEIKNERSGTIVIKSGSIYHNKADFGLVQVRENRSDPESRFTPLPFIRHHARIDSKIEPIFILGGGPGKSNLWSEMPEAFHSHSDVVNVGYRGVDGDVKLKCPEIGKYLTKDHPLSHNNLLELRETLRQTFNDLTRRGIDLNGYTILEIVDDIEAVRRGLGYEKINLFSTSYGTQIAYLYCVRYPNAVKRNLMVGASNRSYRFDSIWQPAVIDKMLAEYNTLWKADADATAKSPDILETIRSVMKTLPVTWNGIYIDPDKVRLATFFSLYETESAAAVFDAFTAAEKGDPGGLALLVLGYDQTVQDTARQYWGDFISKFASGGFDSTRNYETEMDPPGSIIGSPSAKLWWTAISGGGWPFAQIPEEYQELDTVRVPTLIINGQLDFSSPPGNIIASKPYYTNGEIIIMPLMGHMDVFKLQRGAIDHLVERFYRQGVVDTSKYFHRNIDFTPEETLQDEARRIFQQEQNR